MLDYLQHASRIRFVGWHPGTTIEQYNTINIVLTNIILYIVPCTLTWQPLEYNNGDYRFSCTCNMVGFHVVYTYNILHAIVYRYAAI